MDQTQKELEEQLNGATENRKSIEKQLKDTQVELTRLQQVFEENLVNLKVAQSHENTLQEQLYEVQKNNLKQAMSVEGIKKVFGDATPFFMRVKAKALDKVKDVKEFLDGTAFDKKWVDERYEEYKTLCIEKGEEIKSKEEFQTIALAIKEANTTSTETSLYDKMSNISREVGAAKNTIKSVWQTIGVEEKIGNFIKAAEEESKPVDKKMVLQDWITSRNINNSGAKKDMNELYGDYVQFLEHVYGKDNVTEVSYTFKSGSFTTAFNKIMNAQEPVVETTKEKKKSSQKLKK